MSNKQKRPIVLRSIKDFSLHLKDATSSPEEQQFAEYFANHCDQVMADPAAFGLPATRSKKASAGSDSQ